MSHIDLVQIFNDPAKNTAFLESAKQILGKRVLNGDKVASTSLENRAVIQDSQKIMKAAVTELNDKNSPQAFLYTLYTYS